MNTQTALFTAEQQRSTSDDFYTPAWLFDLMGITFDLDVASPPDGLPWIPAASRFTMADDGLVQPWTGRVWMNPPYSKATPWVRKFIEHRNGICLVPMAKSQWFFDLWATADGMATYPRTFDFVNGSIAYAVVFAAFGPECVEAIGRIGAVRQLATFSVVSGDPFACTAVGSGTTPTVPLPVGVIAKKKP